VQEAQEELDRLHAELASRGPAFEELTRRLNLELAGLPVDSPEGVKAARLLTEHKSATGLLEARLPAAHEAVIAGWEALSAALRADWGNKDLHSVHEGPRSR
jgi:hypothetical protein